MNRYPFDDTRLDNDDDLDDLLDDNPEVEYNGNIIGIQHPIMKSARYFAFCYHGYNRFCI